jgi:hypothetical protein
LKKRAMNISLTSRPDMIPVKSAARSWQHIRACLSASSSGGRSTRSRSSWRHDWPKEMCPRRRFHLLGRGNLRLNDRHGHGEKSHAQSLNGATYNERCKTMIGRKKCVRVGAFIYFFSSFIQMFAPGFATFIVGPACRHATDMPVIEGSTPLVDPSAPP